MARFWKQQFLSDKHLKLLYAKEDYADPLCQSLDVEDPEQVLLPVLAALPAQQEDLPDDESPEGLPHERSASHLQILLLMNQALTSSRSGRPRSRPTTKLLVIRPIATWPLGQECWPTSVEN